MKPVESPPLRRRPRRVVHLVALALVGILFSGCDFVEQLNNPEKFAAKVRLQTIMTSVVAKTHMSEQTVICLFLKGSKTQCDTNELNVGLRDFEKWLGQKRITRGIKSFEIVDYWEDPDEKNKAFFFHCLINDKNAYIVVEDRGPIKWAKKKEKPAS